MSPKAQFRLRVEGPQFQKEGPIPIGELTIGRGLDNKLILKNQRVSREHARIEHTGLECRLTDLGSTHGTKINGQDLEPNVARVLEQGDVIEIGPYKLTFSQITDEPLPAGEELTSQPIGERMETGEEPVDQAIIDENAVTIDHSIRQPIEGPLEAEAEPIDQSSEQRLDAGSENNHSSGGGNGLPPDEPPPGSIVPAQPNLPEVKPYGLTHYSRRLIKYLPEIYDFTQPNGASTDVLLHPPVAETFISRFLGIFEGVLTPIEGNIDNFDLYLNPDTTPAEFLPWLATWFQISFDSTWDEAKRRTFLKEAHWLFAWRGTKKALSRVLEIYTGVKPDIEEPEPLTEELANTFNVTIRLPSDQTVDAQTFEQAVERLIQIHKPAHTLHTLQILS